jgi:hypothetical protein
MSSAATPWEMFGAALSEAQRAAAEGRFGDFMTLGGRLERAAATLPPPPPEQLPALQRQFAELCGVLSHIEAVRGALVGVRAEVSGAYGPGSVARPAAQRLLDRRG